MSLWNWPNRSILLTDIVAQTDRKDIMENFPGNSNKGKEIAKSKPEKKVEKVVTGEVVQKHKTIGERFRGIFLGGELKPVTKYIAAEVLLPALRNMIVDATSKGVERMIYGEVAARRGNMRSGPRVSYNNPIDRGARPRAYLPDQPVRRSRDVNNIILSSRAEAELVVERLNDIIEQFDVTSVADLHDLVGLPTTYVDNKWGWTNLHYVDVRQVREGYLIDLPPVEAI